MLADHLKRVGAAAGLTLIRRRNTPFGIRWFDDLAVFVRPEVVFDVGANVGQTVQEVKGAFPSARIFAFEPVPSTFRQLEANVAGFGAVVSINAALGAQGGEARMTNVPGGGKNTLLAQGLSTEETVTVVVDTVDSVAAQHHLNTIDLLKIDTEGFEVPVLQGATKMLQEGRIGAVLAECDFYHRDTEPHAAFTELLDVLIPFGFRVVSFYTGGVDGDGWLWGNVLFVKATKMPFRLSPYE
jgi:FkbM family methyltransferase